MAQRWAKHLEQFQKVFWNDDLRHQFGMTRARTFYEPRIPKIYHWSLGLRAAEHMRVSAVSGNAGLMVENADYPNLYTDVELRTVRDYLIEFESIIEVVPITGLTCRRYGKVPSGKRCETMYSCACRISLQIQAVEF